LLHHSPYENSCRKGSGSTRRAANTHLELHKPWYSPIARCLHPPLTPPLANQSRAERGISRSGFPGSSSSVQKAGFPVDLSASRTKSGRPFLSVVSPAPGLQLFSQASINSSSLNYLHCVPKFLPVFLHIFDLDLFAHSRPTERHELCLKSYADVDYLSRFAFFGDSY